MPRKIELPTKWTDCYELEKTTGIKYVGGKLHQAMIAAGAEFKHYCGGTRYRKPKSDEKVWTATAVYGPNEDVEPIVVVAITSQAASEQLDNEIHEYCDGNRREAELWITYHPVERKVLR